MIDPTDQWYLPFCIYTQTFALHVAQSLQPAAFCTSTFHTLFWYIAFHINLDVLTPLCCLKRPVVQISDSMWGRICLVCRWIFSTLRVFKRKKFNGGMYRLFLKCNFARNFTKLSFGLFDRYKPEKKFVTSSYYNHPPPLTHTSHIHIKCLQ
jgi:hypothetical protein